MVLSTVSIVFPVIQVYTANRRGFRNSRVRRFIFYSLFALRLRPHLLVHKQCLPKLLIMHMLKEMSIFV